MRGFKGGIVPPFMESTNPSDFTHEKVLYVVNHLSYEGLNLWAAMGLLAANKLKMSPAQMLQAMEETFTFQGDANGFYQN